MPVVKRKSTKRQHLAWQQLREWEPLEKLPCYCRHSCGRETEAACLMKRASRGAELVARVEGGAYQWPPMPRGIRVRYPRKLVCRETQNLINLVREQTEDRGAPALWIGHEEYARLANCSVPTARRAQAEAVALGYLQALPAHLAGEELQHRAELRGGNLPRVRISGERVKHLRCGNILRPGRLLLDELRSARSGHTRKGLQLRHEREVTRIREADERRAAATEQSDSADPSASPDHKDQATEDPPRRVIVSSGSGSRGKSNTAPARVESRGAPAAHSERSVPPDGTASARAPLARAVEPATNERATERPTAAPSGVSQAGARSPAACASARAAPAVSAEEARGAGEGAERPRFPDAPARGQRCSDEPTPSEGGESFDDLLMRVRRRFRPPVDGS